MKISLIIALSILFVGGMVGWHDQRRLVSLRTEYETLVLEARKLDVLVVGGSESSKRRLSEREQEEREEKVRLFADQLVAFVNRMEENGGKESEEIQREMVEIMEGMLGLDSKELALLVAEIRANPELDEDMRDGLIGFSLVMLSEHNPQAALTIFTESSDLMGADGEAQWMLSSALTSWAQASPLEALDWIRENAAVHPELVQDDTKEAVVVGASATDPMLALRLIGELELNLDNGLADDMAEACRGVDERLALLRASQNPSVELGEVQRGMILEQMANPLAEEGFTAAAEWLAQVELSGDELAKFSAGLDYHTVRGETAEWIGWAGEHLEGEVLQERVTNWVGSWTGADHQAAGKWLSDVEEGPVRRAGIMSFTETVARHDPAAAAEWARSLPKGDDRDHLTQVVHQYWQAADPESAAAFAAEEGLRSDPIGSESIEPVVE